MGQLRSSHRFAPKAPTLPEADVRVKSYSNEAEKRREEQTAHIKEFKRSDPRNRYWWLQWTSWARKGAHLMDPKCYEIDELVEFLKWMESRVRISPDRQPMPQRQQLATVCYLPKQDGAYHAINLSGATSGSGTRAPGPHAWGGVGLLRYVGYMLMVAAPCSRNNTATSPGMPSPRRFYSSRTSSHADEETIDITISSNEVTKFSVVSPDFEEELAHLTPEDETGACPSPSRTQTCWRLVCTCWSIGKDPGDK